MGKTIALCIAAACVCLTAMFNGVCLLILAATIASYRPTVQQFSRDVQSVSSKVDPALQTGQEIKTSIADGVKAIKEFSIWRDQQNRRRQ